MIKILILLGSYRADTRRSAFRRWARVGTLKGTVRVASGAPVAGVTVIATNQVTRKMETRAHATLTERIRSTYLPALTASRGCAARRRVRQGQKLRRVCDSTRRALENVIVEAGQGNVVDIPLDQVELKEIPRQPGDKPTGHAGTRPFRPNRKPTHDGAKRAIAGASVFPNTIATAIAARAAATFRSSAGAGGIRTTRAS